MQTSESLHLYLFLMPYLELFSFCWLFFILICLLLLCLILFCYLEAFFSNERKKRSVWEQRSEGTGRIGG